MKVSDTIKGRQAGDLALIHYDLEFAARAFASAAESKETIAGEKPTPHLGGMDARKEILRSADPLLRKGGVLSMVDANRESAQSICASSLFEASIARYARCFNSGKRASLSNSSFSGPTSRFRKIHKEIMGVRNRFIAHAEMEHEECIVGFENVTDLNFGVRPNTLFSLLTMRTPIPEPSRLRELSEHCIGIDRAIVIPQLEKCLKNLREEILTMEESQIDRLENLEDYKHKLQKIFSDLPKSL